MPAAEHVAHELWQLWQRRWASEYWLDKHEAPQVPALPIEPGVGTR